MQGSIRLRVKESAVSNWYEISTHLTSNILVVVDGAGRIGLQRDEVSFSSTLDGLSDGEPAAPCMHAHQELLPRSGRSLAAYPRQWRRRHLMTKKRCPTPTTPWSWSAQGGCIYVGASERVSLSCLRVTPILLVDVGRTTLLSKIVFQVWLKLMCWVILSGSEQPKRHKIHANFSQLGNNILQFISDTWISVGDKMQMHTFLPTWK